MVIQKKSNVTLMSWVTLTLEYLNYNRISILGGFSDTIKRIQKQKDRRVY